MEMDEKQRKREVGKRERDFSREEVYLWEKYKEEESTLKNRIVRNRKIEAPQGIGFPEWTRKGVWKNENLRNRVIGKEKQVLVDKKDYLCEEVSVE